jgi:hypothetical protein
MALAGRCSQRVSSGAKTTKADPSSTAMAHWAVKATCSGITVADAGR